jgi:acyl carrier protein
MDKNEFIEKVKEILELEDVSLTENSNLNDFEEYDSISILSVIALIDESFNMKLTSEELESITTVNSLITLIGEEKFN